MWYHTLPYLVLFLPACLAAYSVVSQKNRWKILLAFSCVFFYVMSRNLIIFLFGAAAVSYGTGRWLEKLKEGEHREIEGSDSRQRKEIRKKFQKKKRRVLILGIVLTVGVLVWIKYYHFLAGNFVHIVAGDSASFPFEGETFLMPIGISFYTLQAVGYMADIYWDKIHAQKNPARFLLFLSFFPQIVEGPICRYEDTQSDLFAGKEVTWETIRNGYIRILWGLFKKMVVADRLAALVSQVFDNYREYSGVVTAVAAVAYTVQLYMEFSGCMDIVMGSGTLFGITFPENFRQPFAARSASEFWRRWHISLGTWFKNYIFYPVSVSSAVKKWNQFARKKLGKYAAVLGTSALALFPVWLCNGLWHGPRWSYLFFGMYYFVLIMLGTAVKPVRDCMLSACRIQEESWYWRIVQIGKTWIIIFVGELFFRADGLRAGLHMFRSMFTDFDIQKLWDGTLLGLGMSPADYVIVLIGCIAAAVVGSMKERGISFSRQIGEQALPVRWAVCYILLISLVIFGAYGDGYQAVDLIYAGF